MTDATWTIKQCRQHGGGGLLASSSCAPARSFSGLQVPAHHSPRLPDAHGGRLHLGARRQRVLAANIVDPVFSDPNVPSSTRRRHDEPCRDQRDRARRAGRRGARHPACRRTEPGCRHRVPDPERELGRGRPRPSTRRTSVLRRRSRSTTSLQLGRSQPALCRSRSQEHRTAPPSSQRAARRRTRGAWAPSDDWHHIRLGGVLTGDVPATAGSYPLFATGDGTGTTLPVRAQRRAASACKSTPIWPAQRRSWRSIAASRHAAAGPADRPGRCVVRALGRRAIGAGAGLEG